MIDILLINPQPVVMKDLFAENLMYANPPLGLGYLASAARNAGYSVDLIDVGIDKLTISGIIHRIIEVDAQIVGISSFIANHGNGLKIAHEIKKQFGSQVKVMMGGPQASFVYEEVLKQGDVDIVSIFEGEQTIVELLNCIKTGGDIFISEKAVSQAKLIERCYISDNEREYYKNIRLEDAKLGDNKVKLARRQYRGKGLYIDEILV